jgi:ABC-type polysaccharide/polyol phosphate export permease
MSVQVYDSAHRASAPVEELIEAYRYRHLIVEFIRRDIVTRYKRSWLGLLWTMLNPFGTMLIMVLVFYQLFHVTTPRYPVYVLSGVVTWGFFAQSTALAPQSLLWSHALIHRVYLPKTVFAIVAVGAGLVNMLLALVPLAALTVVLGTPMTPALLILPLAILLIAAFALGISLLLSSVVAAFPDVVDMYAIALTGWLYLSAIFYPYDIIPVAYRWWFFNLNPMYHLILLFRYPLYFGAWPPMAHLVSAAVVALTALGAGWLVFTRRADELAFRI